MMRHLVGKAAPELEHMRVDVAYGGPSARRKYSAIWRHAAFIFSSRIVTDAGLLLARE
jgi:hypothetical protein